MFDVIITLHESWDVEGFNLKLNWEASSSHQWALLNIIYYKKAQFHVITSARGCNSFINYYSHPPTRQFEFLSHTIFIKLHYSDFNHSINSFFIGRIIKQLRRTTKNSRTKAFLIVKIFTSKMHEGELWKFKDLNFPWGIGVVKLFKKKTFLSFSFSSNLHNCVEF